MTLAIAVTLLLMALVQFAAGGGNLEGGYLATEPVNWALGAKVPTLIAHGEYWRLVTASFLHESWLHLGLNLVGLWVLGRLVEAFYGPARMLVIFTLSSLLGVVVSYLATINTSVGASTGVMGLVGAVIWHNWQYRRYLPPHLMRIYRLLLMLVVLQFAMDLQSDKTDVFGHLGGFIGGIVVAMLLESRIAGPKQGENEWLPLGTSLGTAAAVLAYGAGGLALSLPGSMDLLRAGTSRPLEERTAYMIQAAARKPYFTEGRMHLMVLLLSQRREQEARREYLSALATNPSFRSSPYLAKVEEALAAYFGATAVALAASGQPDAGLQKLKSLIDWGAGPYATATGHNDYAWMLVDRLERDLDVAEQHAIIATNKFPNQPAFQDTLAWIYFKTHRPKEALSTQLRAMNLVLKLPLKERTPERMKAMMPEMHYHLAAIYAALGNNTEARENYNKALEWQDGYPPAVEGLRRLDEAPVQPRDNNTPTRAHHERQRSPLVVTMEWRRNGPSGSRFSAVGPLRAAACHATQLRSSSRAI